MTTQLNVNMEMLHNALWGLALSDHMGDVNNELPRLALALGLLPPMWSDEKDRMVWSWEPEYYEDEEGE